MVDMQVGLTGQSATFNIGAVDIFAYGDVDTGSNTSYSDVSTGSNDFIRCCNRIKYKL